MELPGPLAELAPLLDRYGYLAVAGLVLVESFGVPAPAQTLLIAAGVYSGTGRMNVAAVAAVGFLAATCGDSLGYWIGRLGGRRLVLRVGRFVFLTEERLAKAEGVFDRHGTKIVVVARFIDGLRQFNGIVAGVAGMPWWRFLAANATGALVWATLWTVVGNRAGAHIGPLVDAAHRFEPWLLAAAGVVVLGLGVRWWLRRRARGRRARARARSTVEELSSPG